MNRNFMYLLPVVFITVILMIVTGQYKSSNSIDELRKGNQGLLDELSTKNQLQQLKTSVLDLESHGRVIVISGNPYDSLAIEQDIVQLERSITELARLEVNSLIKPELASLRRFTNDKINFTRSILSTYNIEGKGAAEKLISSGLGTRLTDSIQQAADKIGLIHDESVTRLVAQAEDNASRAKAFAMLLALIAAVAALFTFLLVTHRVKQQQKLIGQLNESEQKAREAALLKERFLANMSHEIRTPMNVILGYTNLLEQRQLDASSKDFVQHIRKSGENLLDLISDVLDLSKIESGMMQLQSTLFSIHKLSEQIVSMFTPKASEKGIDLKVDVGDNVPKTLIGDPLRLRQILINLLGNAVKFTHEGSVIVYIKCRFNTASEIVLLIDVMDTGIGMDKSVQDLIFERFRQADHEVSNLYGGTGLGLSIVKDLVSLHKGSIRVNSTPGQGSIFHLEIPYPVADEPMLADTVQEQEASSEIVLAGTHWLVVEDNEMNQSLMSHILRNMSIRFDMADNGLEALKLLEKNRYDLVLMDIQMPEMDGYTAAQSIRNILNQDVPILAITANAMAGEREKCIASGMNDYLSKPVRVEDLVSKAIAALLSRRKDHRFDYIDLRYLLDVSGGDTLYEQQVTDQFIQLLPADLEKMKQAYEAKDDTYRRIAHDLKTTISVMGLNSRMNPLLQLLESGQVDSIQFEQLFKELRQIADASVREAKQFREGLEKK